MNKNLPLEISVSIKIDGIKTTLSVEIYPETFQLLPELEPRRFLTGNTFCDLLVEEIHPIVKELTPRLVEANQIVSGNLLKACVTAP